MFGNPLANKCFNPDRDTRECLLNTQSIENLVSKYQLSKHSKVKSTSSLQKAGLKTNDTKRLSRFPSTITLINNLTENATKTPNSNMLKNADSY